MKIGFIGFGHMGSAMLHGFLRAGAVQKENVYACAANYEKLKERADEINACETALDVAEAADIIFICVKPGTVADLLAPIRETLGGKIVISVAFGIDFDRYEELLGSEVKHISIIPNTPCEICKGITIVEDKHNLSDDELETVKELLGAIGEMEFIATDKMWLAGEVASCGPAFAAMFIEALGDAGAKYGLEQEAAYRIVSKMVEGTGALQAETGKLPGRMVDEVATPGGVTIKGVTALRDANFHDTVALAIDAIESGKSAK